MTTKCVIKQNNNYEVSTQTQKIFLDSYINNNCKVPLQAYSNLKTLIHNNPKYEAVTDIDLQDIVFKLFRNHTFFEENRSDKNVLEIGKIHPKKLGCDIHHNYPDQNKCLLEELDKLLKTPEFK